MTIFLKDDLQQVRDTIAKGWCQGSYALNNDKFPVDYSSPDACKWCLSGAIMKIPGSAWIHIQNIIEKRIRDKTGLGIIRYNDSEGRTQEEVLALLDELIAEIS